MERIPIEQRLQQLRSESQTQPVQSGGVRVPIEERLAQLRGEQQKPKSIEQQKAERQAQGLPVSVRSDRAEPTLGGGIVRGIAQIPIKAALTIPAGAMGERGLTLKSKYLGDVSDIGKGIRNQADILSERVNRGEISKGRAYAGALGKAGMETLDVASVVPIGQVGTVARAGLASKMAIPTTREALKQSAIRGGAFGAGYDISSQLASGDKYKPQRTIGAAALGTALDFAPTKLLPESVELGRRKFSSAKEYANPRVDKEIRSILSSTTDDLQTLEDRALKSKKALDLLVRESDTIEIPDKNAPIGSNLTKKFNTIKSDGNEFLSALKEMEKRIATIARNAAEDASSNGNTLPLNDVQDAIRVAIDEEIVPRGVVKKIANELKLTGGDPVKIHDWVQSINQKYGPKYNKGTIGSNTTSEFAHDVAQILRESLETVVDRKGYAEAFGNNRELWRMVLAIAKKANKNIDFGDISTDAGLDGAISLLTGNPAYMGRTVASGAFKVILRKFMNNSGLRSLRSAAKDIKNAPTDARLPFGVAKPKINKQKLLPEGRGPAENYSPIRLPSPRS